MGTRCEEEDNCSYVNARNAFTGAAISVTNTAYALTCARYGHAFVAGDLLFVDEAHKLNDEICALYKIVVPFDLDDNLPPAGGELEWVIKDYLPNVYTRIELISRRLAGLCSRENLQRWTKDLERLKATLGLSWISGVVKNAFIALRSPFPTEHRLIYSWPVIHWPRHDQNQITIGPTLAQAVNRILELHPDKRGIIHSVSYSRTKLLLEYCQSPRLFTHTQEESFDEAVERLATTEHAVLVSPRATEGVDLKGDRSEFQIFIKIPFQFLGDPLVRGRQATNKGWYDLMAAIAVVQGAGRSIRTATDIAPTYILDGRWPSWFRINKYLFPEYFRDAMRPFTEAA